MAPLDPEEESEDAEEAGLKSSAGNTAANTEIIEAAKNYTSLGIVTMPLFGPNADCKAPGKQPIKFNWQRQTVPSKNPDAEFKGNRNIGFVTGRCSDLTVIDVDWFIKGIWEGVLKGIDITGFIKSSHTPERWHWLFRYSPELTAGQYQYFGFDVLSDAEKTQNGKTYIAGNNCVATPSIHKDGSKYVLSGDVAARPIISDVMKARIVTAIQVHGELKVIISKCRPWLRNLFKAVFETKNDALYHDATIFYGDMEGRKRCLAVLAELNANGAEFRHLLFVCCLMFGERYDEAQSVKELDHIKAKPAKTESLLADPILSRFCEQEHQNKKKSDKAGTEELTAQQILDTDYDEAGFTEDNIKKAEEEAMDILKNGDPLQYILDTCAKQHTGDVNTLEGIGVSIAGQSCLNTNGLHPAIHGESGSGKSHGMKTELHLVPRKYKRETSLSAKSAFYMGLKEGMILYSDDTEIGAEMESTIKRATTYYQEWTQHTTVKDQESLVKVNPHVSTGF